MPDSMNKIVLLSTFLRCSDACAFGLTVGKLPKQIKTARGTFPDGLVSNRIPLFA